MDAGAMDKFDMKRSGTHNAIRLKQRLENVNLRVFVIARNLRKGVNRMLNKNDCRCREIKAIVAQ
jgi:hypothetical protein